jgi:hypothetical protein
VSPLLLVAIAKPSWLGGHRLGALAQEGEDPRSLGKRVSLARSMEVGSVETLPALMVASAAMVHKAAANQASPQ